jgi:hypothetical protein
MRSMPAANSVGSPRIVRRDHGFGAGQAGNDAAAIDIADQHHRNADSMRETHIGDVVFPQIDFGGAAGAFHQHDVGLAAQPFVAVEDERQQIALHMLIGGCLGAAVDAALHDDLCADFALRLEQHWIHMHARRHACCTGLQRLRPADLAAIDGHGGIVRHVLRLERAHGKAAQGQSARQAGDDERLAHIGAGTLEHQRARRHI